MQQRSKERSSVDSVNKLSIIVPFDFLFVAREHRIWSSLFEEAALAASLNKEKQMYSCSDRFVPIMSEQNSIA